MLEMPLTVEIIECRVKHSPLPLSAILNSYPACAQNAKINRPLPTVLIYEILKIRDIEFKLRMLAYKRRDRIKDQLQNEKEMRLKVEVVYANESAEFISKFT